MERKHWLLFNVILFTALLLRLWLAPMRGHVHDIEQLKAWTETAVTQNPLGIYSYSTANYPPLGLLPLWLMGHLYRAFFSPEFDTSSTTLTALIKLPGITADLLTAVLLFRYLSREYGLRWGLIGMAAYALNPAILYNTAWWGQLESLAALPMLLALLALADGRIHRAWFWLALAVLVKPQAAVIGPVILIGSFQIVSRKGRKNCGAQGAKGLWEVVVGIVVAVVTAVIVLLPFIVAGQLPALLAQIRASAGRQLFLTMNAHNFWYLLTLGRGSFAARNGGAGWEPLYDTGPLLGPLTGWQIGILLYLLWTIFISSHLLSTVHRPLSTDHRLLFTANRSLTTVHHPPSTIFWAAAAMVIGFYMLPAEAHERYLFPAFVFLALLLPLGRPYRLIYLLFTITFLLNLLWVDPALPLPGFQQNLTAAIPLAALNLLLLILFSTQNTKKRL